MKNKYTAIAIGLFMASNLYAVTLQNNYLCIRYGKVVDFTLNPTESYSITKGEPFEGVKGYVRNGDMCINVLAGRSLSTTPVAWVKSGFNYQMDLPWSSKYMKATPGTFSSTPEKLYFVIRGTLKFTKSVDNYSITYVCNNVAIGAGSSVQNNWWMFNNVTPYVNPTERSIICTNSKTNKEVKFKYDSVSSLDNSRLFKLLPEQ